MKKIIAIFVSSILLVFMCFAEEFKGFLGIPFDSPSVEVRSIMESKGWTYMKYFDFCGKTYAGKEVENISMSFEYDRLKSVTINFKKISDANEVMVGLFTKYELTQYKNFFFFYTKDKKESFFLHSNILIILGGKDEITPLDETEL
ncbi:MAG: hypothetical protein J6Y75_09420 [Spirochaetaceae bacterium]|nr:hypothetical protein [Spirochaetaceae bacterium]